MQTRQSDITSQGYLFSAVVIFLGNVCVLLFGIPLLTAKVGLLNALGWWLEGTGRFSTGCSNGLNLMCRKIVNNSVLKCRARLVQILGRTLWIWPTS